MAKNMRKDYWDLTQRPHTELKLTILEEYVYFWADFLLKLGIKNEWKTFQEIYYIDCFAGRGKYHKDGAEDSIPGSPLIGLNCALAMSKKYEGKAKVHCMLVEENKKNFQELEIFCEAYSGKVEFTLMQRDFNECCEEIIGKIGQHPSFFFIDPGGIQVKKETIQAIAKKEGPNDLLFNYIKGGPERITGLMKKTDLTNLDEKEALKRLKTFKTLEDFYGATIYNSLEKNEKERLQEWVETILKSGKLKECAVFDMPYPKRKDAIYYLLFASRKQVANKIIKHIFTKAKTTDYDGQARLFVPEDHFEI